MCNATVALSSVTVSYFCTFLNRSTQTVRLVWLSGDGGRRKYDTIRRDSDVTRQTFENHVWLVETENGKPLGVYQVKRDGQTVVIGGGNRRSKPTAQNLMKLRALAKLFLDNGIHSMLIKPDDNIANLTWEKLRVALKKNNVEPESY